MFAFSPARSSNYFRLQRSGSGFSNLKSELNSTLGLDDRNGGDDDGGRRKMRKTQGQLVCCSFYSLPPPARARTKLGLTWLLGLADQAAKAE